MITVVEDTPLSYEVNFKTSEEDLTTPTCSHPCVRFTRFFQPAVPVSLCGFSGLSMM